MSLEPMGVVLLALHAFGESVTGKTLLQKRLYFLGELLRIDLGYHAHFYGPYSDLVSEVVSSLKSACLLDESPVNFGIPGDNGFERRRFDYRLTADGRVAVESLVARERDLSQSVFEAADRIKNAGNLDYQNLSIAAKAHFILKKSQKPMSSSAIREEAEKFGWQITDQNIVDAIEYLRKLKMVSIETET